MHQWNHLSRICLFFGGGKPKDGGSVENLSSLHAHHALAVFDYDPKTGLVTVENSWGLSVDHTGREGSKPPIPIEQLYAAYKDDGQEDKPEKGGVGERTLQRSTGRHYERQVGGTERDRLGSRRTRLGQGLEVGYQQISRSLGLAKVDRVVQTGELRARLVARAAVGRQRPLAVDSETSVVLTGARATYPRLGCGGDSSPMTLVLGARPALVSTAVASDIDVSSLGRIPTTASGPSRGSDTDQSEIEANCPGPAPTSEPTRLLNFATLPSVASASSAAVTNGS